MLKRSSCVNGMFPWRQVSPTGKKIPHGLKYAIKSLLYFHSFWEKCSETFAEQLLEKGFALQAATYMLAIRRQQTAIQMLLKGQFYKEALLLARIYLQPDDPLREKIVNEWTEYFCSNGNLTSAALM